ncbi:MAG: aminotransferase class V-fold PLP-dependent enzyme [Candidatus Aminicenantes bacterium]|nr:aminotransferase class V-fold PLP-dependent enzyme [Candidatus Aminicenantes bacterium]
MIYLDNNATTQIDPQVCEKMSSFLKNRFGNPSSLYPIGREVKESLNEARENIAGLLGAERSEIIFTGSGTESDNFAIRGVMEAFPEKDEFVTSAVEHPAVIETAHYLKKSGKKVTFVPVDQTGLVDLEELEKKVTSRTALVSIMHANNEVGTLQPIDEIVRIAKNKDVLMHTDAVQTFGKIKFDVHKLGVDLLSVSGHKIYGPKGVGALFVKKGTSLAPLIHGGHQEGKLRAGTENTAGIVGFGEAARIAKERLNKDKKRLEGLAEKLKNGIESRISDVKFNGPEKERIPTTLNFSFLKLEAEAVLLALATKGIYVSTGSACSEDSDEVSHVLTAIGLTPEQARSAIRFSLGRFNTEEDIHTVLQELPDIVRNLREISMGSAE